MTFQIVARPVSTAHYLDPALQGTNTTLSNSTVGILHLQSVNKCCSKTYIGSFGFSIPAVTGVVGHLVVHVLTEAQLVFGYTDFSKVEVDPPDEISQDGVIDHSLNERSDERNLFHSSILYLQRNIL